MTQTLRAIVVNCGVGRNIADSYMPSDAAKLVALGDIDEIPLNRVADANDVEAWCTDIETMLREERSALINIATARPLSPLPVRPQLGIPRPARG